MKPGKSCELTTFYIEHLINHKYGNLWHAVALLSNLCVAESYPQRLNQMLLLPLNKKGDKINPYNY